jgi:dTDP-4-amino-4,6-dideoxygalactose transaminase
VIRASRRDELQAFLKSKGVFTGIHYPVPNHLQPALKSLGYKQGDLPVTELVVTEILSLPMFAELSDGEIQAVTDLVKEFYAAG